MLIFPPNHGKNLRLEYLILEALKSNGNNKKLVSVEELKKIITGNIPYHHLEDPPSTLFTENVTSSLGNNIVYTGNYEQGVFTLNNILEATHFNLDKFPKAFFEKMNAAFILLLGISNTIAKRMKHERNLDGTDQSHNSEIKFPSNIETYKGAILFTSEWLINFCENMRIDSSIIDSFTLSYDEIQNTNNVIGESDNPLAIKPICKLQEGFLVVAPTCIVGALIHFVWVQSEISECKNELIISFHDAVWKEIFFYRNKLGLKAEKFEFVLDRELPIKFALFRFDDDKILLFTILYDEGSEYTLHSPRHKDPMLKVEDQKKLHEINYQLIEENYPKDKILNLILYSSIGREYMFLYPSDQMRFSLITTAYFFLCWVKSNTYDIIDLWYYLDTKKRLEDKIDSRFLDFLNTFSFYKENNNSFYLGDSQKPTHFPLFPGGELDILRDAIVNEDRILAYHKLDDPHPVLIPVVRFKDYIPRYYNLDLAKEQFEYYIPGFSFDIWLRAKSSMNDISNEEFQLYWELSEAICFWLWQVRVLLNEHLKLIHLFSVILSYEIDDFEKFNSPERFGKKQENVSEKFKLKIEKEKIIIKIPYEIIGHFSSEDNEGERILLRKILESFGLLLESHNLSNTLNNESINKIIEEKAPLGLKKILLAMNSANSIQIDPRNLVNPIYLKESRVQWVMDLIVPLLGSNCPPVGEITDKENKMKLAINIVRVLLDKLRVQLKDYNSIDVLKRVMANYEAIVHEKAVNLLRTPTRKLCFADQENIVLEMDEKARLVDSTSLACRCLIEHLSIEPTFGNQVINQQLIDDLMAIMSLIIWWGGLGDRIKFDLFNIYLAILPSGRIGTNSEEITKMFFDGFSEARAKKYVDDSIEYFPSFFSSENSEDNLLSQSFETAFTNEVGISFNKLSQIIYLLIHLGFEQNELVASLTIGDLKKNIEINFQHEINDEEVDSAISFLKIWNWGNVLSAPSGFEGIDISPWRYNRKLSYLQRPLIYVDYTGTIYSPIIYWTPRHVNQSFNYLYQLLLSGRYRADQKSELESQISKISKNRSSVLQKEVVSWLKANCSCFSIDEEVTIAPNGLLKHTKNIGDIDVFAIDKTNQIILSIECKRTESARNAKEMIEQVEQYYGRGSNKGYFKKHIERHEYIITNLDELKRVYKLDFTNYRIVSLFITYEILAIQFMKDKPLPIPMYSLLDLNNFKYDDLLKHLLNFYYHYEQKRNIQIDEIIAKKIDNVQTSEEIQFLESIKLNRICGKSGELQINLIWNTLDDLDLHVETPMGEIYFGNKRIEYDNVGAELDMDANADLPFLSNPQENIVWDKLPRGIHLVKVLFFESREKTVVPFVLTIISKIGDVDVYEGVLDFDIQKEVKIVQFELVNDKLRFTTL